MRVEVEKLLDTVPDQFVLEKPIKKEQECKKELLVVTTVSETVLHSLKCPCSP